MATMARARSPEKRSAILEAAVQEIAKAGLGAPTAKIARRAGVAEGTLFTYFATKEELLNELYVELKLELYRRVNAGFPHKAGLERRVRHVWASVLEEAVASPAKRKVSVLLNVSHLITPETRARTAPERSALDATMRELGRRSAMRGLPEGFAGATMMALQEATMDCIASNAKQREQLIDRAFAVFWRAVR
ncbi:MAG: regulatory protein TetR [Acidobacteriaceae bacterium]|nr:regulatory protein TetR [Acidobacteriaceae bacterium]